MHARSQGNINNLNEAKKYLQLALSNFQSSNGSYSEGVRWLNSEIDYLSYISINVNESRKKEVKNIFSNINKEHNYQCSTEETSSIIAIIEEILSSIDIVLMENQYLSASDHVGTEADSPSVSLTDSGIPSPGGNVVSEEEIDSEVVTIEEEQADSNGVSPLNKVKEGLREALLRLESSNVVYKKEIEYLRDIIDYLSGMSINIDGYKEEHLKNILNNMNNMDDMYDCKEGTEEYNFFFTLISEILSSIVLMENQYLSASEHVETEADGPSVSSTDSEIPSPGGNVALEEEIDSEVVTIEEEQADSNGVSPLNKVKEGLREALLRLESSNVVYKKEIEYLHNIIDYLGGMSINVDESKKKRLEVILGSTDNTRDCKKGTEEYNFFSTLMNEMLSSIALVENQYLSASEHVETEADSPSVSSTDSGIPSPWNMASEEQTGSGISSPGESVVQEEQTGSVVVPTGIEEQAARIERRAQELCQERVAQKKEHVQELYLEKGNLRHRLDYLKLKKPSLMNRKGLAQYKEKKESLREQLCTIKREIVDAEFELSFERSKSKAAEYNTILPQVIEEKLVNFGEYIKTLRSEQSSIQKGLYTLKNQKGSMEKGGYKNKKSELKDKFRMVMKKRWVSFFETNVEDLGERQDCIDRAVDSPKICLGEYGKKVSIVILDVFREDINGSKKLLKDVLKEVGREVRRERWKIKLNQMFEERRSTTVLELAKEIDSKYIRKLVGKDQRRSTRQYHVNCRGSEKHRGTSEQRCVTLEEVLNRASPTYEDKRILLKNEIHEVKVLLKIGVVPEDEKMLKTMLQDLRKEKKQSRKDFNPRDDKFLGKLKKDRGIPGPSMERVNSITGCTAAYLQV